MRHRSRLRARRYGGRVPGFLVFFVTDDVDDDLARDLRRRIRALGAQRSWAGHVPGFFDDPDPGEGIRTTGGYLRIESAVEDDALAVLEAATDVSELHEVTVELQWQERVLGHIRDGAADPGLHAAVRRAGAG